MTKSYPFFMPTLGDQITLTADWVFPLENERRNMDFYLRGIVDFSEAAEEAHRAAQPPAPPPVRAPSGWTYVVHVPMTQEVTIPKGTVLQIDRIYLRRGVSDYDSITFLIKGSPDPLLAPMTGKQVKALQAGTKSAMVKRGPWDITTPKPSMRFWAKLTDVRRITGDLVPA